MLIFLQNICSLVLAVKTLNILVIHVTTFPFNLFKLPDAHGNVFHGLRARFTNTISLPAFYVILFLFDPICETEIKILFFFFCLAKLGEKK